MSVLEGKSAVVTGGAGFIGSHMALKLSELGVDVTIVDAFLPDSGANHANLQALPSTVAVEELDIRDSESMRHLLRGRDLLFNLAAQTGHVASMRDPITDLDINARAHLALLEECRQENPGLKVLYASTRQVYGRPQYLPVDELHPTRPVDVNGVSKLSAEWFHLVYGDVYGMRTCVVRLTNTYGPHMRIKDAQQMFLGAWIRQALERQGIEVWGGDQIRDLTYVDDVVDAFVRLASSDLADGRVFNVGGIEPVSLRAVAEMLVQANGSGEVTIRAFPADRKRIDIGDYYADWSLLREEFGWRPTVPLAEGLARTLAFYRQHLTTYL